MLVLVTEYCVKKKKNTWKHLVQFIYNIMNQIANKGITF